MNNKNYNRIFEDNVNTPFFRPSEIAKHLGYKRLNECGSVINTSIANGELTEGFAKQYAEIEGFGKVEMGIKRVILNPLFKPEK